MNKKLFSAAIFGALLLGTASTFVSCKDYDDDIQNLQTQVNDVKAAVAALEAKIGNGKLVTGVSSTATGITISLSDGSSYTVTNGKDGVDGAPGAAGADAQQITINEETGELMINGEGTGIKPATEVAKEEAKAPVKAEGGFWYVLNEDGEYDNTNIPVSGVTVTGNDLTGYTLTITTAEGTKEIKLPTAASALNTITGTGTFTSAGSVGINWGVAPAAVDWAGPMGAIAKGQLLVGEIAPVTVTVSPATYALDQQTLTFVASDGTVAPVKVTATAIEGILSSTATRAAQSGAWELAIEMGDAVTAKNIDTIFTDEDIVKNLLYALAVNGSVATGYDFVIDTWTATEAAAATGHTATATNLKMADGTAITAATLKTAKTTKLSYNDSRVVDAYLTFEGAAQVSAAEALGVTVDGLSVTAPAKAGSKSVQAELHTLDILGNDTQVTVTINFAGSTVDAGATVATTTYKVNAVAANNTNIAINVDGAFSGLTEAQVASVGSVSVDFKVAADATKFIYTLAPTYAQAINADNTIKTAFAAATDDLRTLKYVVIPVSAIPATAEAGEYTLVLTVKDNNAPANEIKKIEMPVAITLPTFDEIFTKSAAWSGNTLTLDMDNAATVDFSTAYQYDSAIIPTVEFKKINGVYPADDTTPFNATVMVPATATKTVLVNEDGTVNDATANVVLSLGGKMKVESGEFTVKFISPLNGAKLVNYVNGEAAAIEFDGTAGKIAAFTAATTTPATKDAGLAMVVKGKKYALNAAINGVTLDATPTTGNTEFTFDAKAGNNANVTLNSDGSLDITGLATAAQTYTTNLTIKVTDGNGIVSTFVLPITAKF